MVEMLGYAPWDDDPNAAPWNSEPPDVPDEEVQVVPIRAEQTAEIQIPRFSKNDFYTSKPYEWLEQFGGDAFLQQTLVQRLKEYAGTVGVKSFVTLLSKYRDTHSQVVSEQNRTTAFDAQPVELVSGEYVCGDDGITKNNALGFPMVVCRHPILPVRRLVNVDTGEERLEIAYRKGFTWRRIVVEKSIIASSTSILQLSAFGVMVNSENAKLLSTYLLDMEQLNYDTIKETRSVGRMGWVLPGVFSPYLDDIAFDGESNFAGLFTAVKQEGDRQTWIDAMRSVRSEQTVARVFLAASFASVLIEPCGLLPFFVHAWGGSGNGKTVSLMVAASVWASPKKTDYIMTFNSTDVGQEMVAGFLNSLPLCMDELQIQSSQGKKDFDATIYKLSEGQGKTRGAKTGGIRQTASWKNCILTTGEYPITNQHSMGGAVNRVIEFECEKKVYSDLIGLCGIIESNYGWAGREFIDWLLQNGNMNRIRELQKEYFKKLSAMNGTDKQAGSLSAILAADEIATELFFQDGMALTPDDISDMMVEASKADPNVRAGEFFLELVGRNPVHFKPDDNGEYKSEVWGKDDDDKVFVVRSVLERELGLAGYNATAFISWAERHDMLETDKGKKSVKTARIGGVTIKCICVKRYKLTEFVDGGNLGNASGNAFGEDELPF